MGFRLDSSLWWHAISMRLHEVADQLPYIDFLWVDTAAHWIISTTMITGGTMNSSDGKMIQIQFFTNQLTSASLVIQYQTAALNIAHQPHSQCLLMVSESHHKGNNAPSVKRVVVDEQRLRPGHLLQSVLHATFSALTPSVG